MFRDQGAVPGARAEDLDRRIEESYAKRLY
jgi:hypothetical protein